MENALRDLKSTTGEAAAGQGGSPGACPMAEQTTAYAFGELGPEAGKKAKEHLTACRDCLELYMDIGMAEEDAKNGMNEKSEVLRRLQEAIAREKAPPAPSTWRRIGHAISCLFYRKAS